ncbi:MAG: right-handed parallel beta-helix repeat-containing protein, partial [Thermodesulfovibrionales bacterium]|nr:right-handed parallel beta-helix repeat-containing protein [Thermodesulfovibrionales bacterium]
MKKLTAALSFMVLFLGMAGGAMAITIMDDATGGDCSSIGIWDAGTKTCTLTMDLFNLYPGIEIGSDGITLDGNGHVISGVGAGIGVQIYGRRYVVVKNLDITQFEYGMYIVRSSDNRISNNTLTNNNHSGIVLAIGNNNIIERNNSMYHHAFGIFVASSRGNTFTDNILHGGQWGISLGNSHNNALLRNVVNSTYPINIGNSSNNTVAENTISGSLGIELASYSTSNKFFNNRIATTYRAISIWYFANSNVFYNNNVIQGGWGWLPIYCGTEAGMNTFSLEAPSGGNYWGNYDSPEEGCNDANNDGFCDAAFVTCVGTDYLPWTKQDGWLTPETLIGGTITAVEELLTSGDIATVGTATSLTSTLNNA